MVRPALLALYPLPLQVLEQIDYPAEQALLLAGLSLIKPLTQQAFYYPTTPLQEPQHSLEPQRSVRSSPSTRPPFKTPITSLDIPLTSNTPGRFPPTEPPGHRLLPPTQPITTAPIHLQPQKSANRFVGLSVIWMVMVLRSLLHPPHQHPSPQVLLLFSHSH